MSAKKCCVMGCKSVAGGEATLFQFPYDATESDLWMEFSQNVHLKRCENRKRLRMCSMHFDDDSFVNVMKKKRLVKGALPRKYNASVDAHVGADVDTGAHGHAAADAVESECVVVQNMESADNVLGVHSGLTEVVCNGDPVSSISFINTSNEMVGLPEFEERDVKIYRFDVRSDSVIDSVEEKLYSCYTIITPMVNDNNVPEVVKLCYDFETSQEHCITMEHAVSVIEKEIETEQIIDKEEKEIDSKPETRSAWYACNEHIMSIEEENKIGKKKCSAQNCSNSLVYRYMHSFPSVYKNVNGHMYLDDVKLRRCRQWVKAAGCPALLDLDPRRLANHYYLCKEHFKENDVDPSLFNAVHIAEEFMEIYDMRWSIKIENIEKHSNDKCCVLNCHDSHPSLQSFPKVIIDDIDGGVMDTTSLNRCLQWIQSSGNRNLLQLHPMILQRSDMKICAKHFSNTMETMETLDPTIDLPQPLSFDEMNVYKTLMTVNRIREQYTENVTNLEEQNTVKKEKTTAVQSRKSCCAPGCTNTNQLRHMHQFPNVFTYRKGVRFIHDGNYDRFIDWITVIGNPELAQYDPHDVYKKYRLCSDHFHESCYTNAAKRMRLRNLAVPTYMNNPPLNSEIIAEYKNEMDKWKAINSMFQQYTPMTRISDDVCAKGFEDHMKEFKVWTCDQCHESSLRNTHTNQKCVHKDLCWQFSNINNMNPGEVPEELQGLTFTEEQLIARVHPMITVFKLKGHQYGYKGNIINFCQDVKSFAKVLPHNINDLSSIINVIRKNKDGDEIQHQVRVAKIRNALMWLKNHNPFYADIEISEENLQLLPENGDITDNLQSVYDDSIDTDSHEDNINLNIEDDDLPDDILPEIHESYVPNLKLPDQEKQIHQHMKWPEYDEEPIDEFHTVGYIACAFPTLFPHGSADLRDHRVKEIKPTAYFKHLMSYHDQRFAKHKTFRFFAYNSLMRWTAISDGNVFIRNEPEFKNMTVEKLKDMMKDNPNIIKKIMYYASNLRGSKAFWHTRAGELEDMVNQLGLPTIFLTLSCADGHWPDLYRILTNSDDVSNLSNQQRRDLVQNNPHIVDMFFDHRIRAFIEHVLQKKYEVVDFWYRVEYQHRGSPHLHGLFWIKGAPDVTDLDKNIEKRDEVLKYFSNLISAINPDRNCDEPDTHPCKTRYDDIDNFQEDLSQLLNKVQRHSQHNDHCMRVNRKTKKKACRFNFPKSLQETSTLERIDETGEYEFNPQRNDDKLNKYNEYIIQLWRANMDIAPVISKKALVAYLTKYITKGETNSLALDELLNTIITTMDNENRAVTAIRKLFMKSCVERDISAQEVCHTLNGLKLYSAGGRKFNIVNFNSNSWLRLSGDDNDTFGSNFIEKYLKRPPHLENVTLWQAALIYNVPSWTRTAKDNIVRIFPRLKTNISEEFYRQKVLLHIPWRDENAMRKNRSWQDIYMSHNVNLFGDRTNTISLHDTIEDDFEENINTDDDITDEEDMIVSKMGPNKNVPHVGVGRRDIDIQHDWTEGMKKYEKYGCVADFENFIAKAKKNEKANDIQYILPDVNFSHDQHEVISLFDSQIKNILNQACNTIKTVIVQGKAGTGKSLIIKYMKAKLQHDIGENALLLGAPTGMAALLIGGNTIHSLFHIPKKRNEFKPLQGEREKTLCGKFKNVKFLIIDEFSLLGSCTLAMIDARCKQATGNHMEDFGGLHVYFFGDLKQLPPVKDSALYATNHPSLLAKHGKGVFNRIQRAFILSTSHRQNDAVFLDILDRISNGTHTKNDYDYISKRFKHTLPESEKSKFTDAIRLFAKSDDVIEYNLNQLMNAKDTLTGKLTPIARINAKHNCSMAKQGSSDDADGLTNILYVAKGCKIMLRKNLWVHKGLVNGALGKIVDIVYDAEVITPDSTPAILMCEFETYSGPGLIPDTKIIPLQPELTTWTSKSGEKCSRLQFPIALAYACSIHKSQGMTLNKVVINVGDKEFSIGLMYVALSRVRTITNMIIHPFPYSRMEKLKCKGSQETIKLRNAAIQMLSQKSCT